MCLGEIVVCLVQFLDFIYDIGYDVEIIVELILLENIVLICVNLGNVQFCVVVYRIDVLFVDYYVGIVVYKINGLGVVVIVVKIVIFVNSVG